MTDIVERLRNPYGQTGADRRRNIKEAADEIERLRKDAKNARYYRNKSGRDQHDGIEALKAENAKLREALDFIADTPMKWTKPQNDVYWANLAVAFAKVADDARAALASSAAEGESK